MAQALIAPPERDFLQKTLSAELLEGVTAAASLNNTTGIQNLPGVFIIDRIDANGTETPNKVEVVKFAGTSGSTVITLTRGLAGTTDQDHAVSAIVEYSPDVVWAQSVYDALSAVVVPSTGVLDTTKVLDLTTAQTATNKTLTSPVINTGISGTAILDEDDMASDSATKVPTQQSVKAYVDANSGSSDGWTESADTWVYASASTFTITGVDRTTIYTKGTRLKFTQTSVKYAVVVSSSFSTNTTVTIAVNTDYTIANAAITDPSYSYQTNPQGYPGSFAFTSTASGFSAVPTNVYSQFKVDGNQCTTWIAHGVAGTSNATSFSVTAPIASANISNALWGGFTQGVDNGAFQSAPTVAQLGANTNIINLYKDSSGASWTGSGGKRILGLTISYEI